jgi:hypothetical protein
MAYAGGTGGEQKLNHLEPLQEWGQRTQQQPWSEVKAREWGEDGKGHLSPKPTFPHSAPQPPATHKSTARQTSILVTSPFHGSQ